MLRIRLPILTILALVGLGVTGYEWIEGWSFLDALYMTVITLATVGYTEVHPLSPTGRLFTIFLISVGVTAVGFLIRGILELIADEEAATQRKRRRMQKQIAALQGHTIVCGYGRMGQEIAREFTSRRIPVVVVERDPGLAALLSDAGLFHVIADATDDAALLAAGIERAGSLIAVAHTDADNIFIVLSARSLNPKVHIVARSILEQDEHKLRRAGADRVISPYVIGARRIAAAVLHPEVVEYVDLQALRAESEMEAVTVTATSPFRDQTVGEVRITEQTGCVLLAVRPREATGTARRFRSNPAADTPIREGDVLIVLGTLEQLRALERMLRRS